MQLWKLFITALMPVLKLLLLTAVGAFLALHRFNILRKSARKHLNVIVCASKYKSGPSPSPTQVLAAPISKK
ncbi:hypothetical protein JHK87_057060 [Glycine soja]|nr:hypothetical protein JHK87_057060 [Glycine soja]